MVPVPPRCRIPGFPLASFCVISALIPASIPLTRSLTKRQFEMTTAYGVTRDDVPPPAFDSTRSVRGDTRSSTSISSSTTTVPHKHPVVRAWLAEHPRFPPALHADERLVVEPRRALVCCVTARRSDGGTFESVRQLERAIHRYIKSWNQSPNPSSGPRRLQRFVGESVTLSSYGTGH